MYIYIYNDGSVDRTMKEITKEEKNWNDTSYEDTAKGHIGNGDTPRTFFYQQSPIIIFHNHHTHTEPANYDMV